MADDSPREPLRLLNFPRAGRAAARPVLATSVAVFRADGRVLLATRTREPARGLWSLPGGKVEAGETLEEAALRELREEVGVIGRIVAFNRHVELIHRETLAGQPRVTHHFVVASFVADWVAGEGLPGPEAGDVTWADPARLGGLPTTRDLASVVRAAHELWRGRPVPR
jgi:ADP-ribose pyrophosphatase YjhB (NUDIX family)